jgi:hypothetical protein
MVILTLCNEGTAECVLLEEGRIRTVRFAMKVTQSVYLRSVIHMTVAIFETNRY